MQNPPQYHRKRGYWVRSYVRTDIPTICSSGQQPLPGVRVRLGEPGATRSLCSYLAAETQLGGTSALFLYLPSRRRFWCPSEVPTCLGRMINHPFVTIRTSRPQLGGTVALAQGHTAKRCGYRNYQENPYLFLINQSLNGGCKGNRTLCHLPAKIDQVCKPPGTSFTVIHGSLCLWPHYTPSTVKFRLVVFQTVFAVTNVVLFANFSWFCCSVPITALFVLYLQESE